MMAHGRNTGKKQLAVRIVKHAFEIMHLLTDRNPLEVRSGAGPGTCTNESELHCSRRGNSVFTQSCQHFVFSD